MACSTITVFVRLLLLATTALAQALQPHDQAKDSHKHATRDENFTSTPGSPQNFCGESTFVYSADTSGPYRDDCALLHRTVQRNLHGYWMVSKFGSDGTVWVEFTRLRSCGFKIRRTDGRSGSIPIGDSDVVGLVNSVLDAVSAGGKMPTTQGNMTCSKGGSDAAVEWKLCAV